MGNRTSSESRGLVDVSSIPSCLQVLGSPKSTLAERRRAFDIVQAECAPCVSSSPAYASELRRVFDLRYEAWKGNRECYVPLHSSQLSKEQLADRIRGVVFGAALGDAVGLSTEFMSREQVAQCYPEGHDFRPAADVYPDSHRVMFSKGDWTDDTDQLLLILQTLLEHGGFYHASFAAKLLRWKEEGFAGLGDQGGAGLGRSTKAVMAQPDFLTQPSVAARRIWKKAGRTLAPNGAVMRTAVTGIPAFWDADSVRDNTLAFCRATHADPRCAASCVAVAECVRSMLQGAGAERMPELINGAVASAASQLKFDEQSPDSGSTGADDSALAEVPEADWEQWRAELHRFAHVETLDALELDDPRSLGYTFKCLGCGLWALRVACSQGRPFSAIIHDVVRAGGDADTNAAVAGGLLGAFLGFSALPQDWVAELPYCMWLEAWVQKLLWMFELPIAAKRVPPMQGGMR